MTHPNSWNPGITTVIPEDKGKAIQGCSEERADFRIFTDGLLTEKGVGAAAIIYRKRENPVTIQARLGDACNHTVYEAECAAMALGIFLIKKRVAKTVTIHMDNQAAIRAAANQKQGSGKYILDAFHAQVEALRKKNSSLKLKIRWSPGHVGIKGNEEADVAAKAATKGWSAGKMRCHCFSESRYHAVNWRRNSTSMPGSRRQH
jgi:ribonuclease HI